MDKLWEGFFFDNGYEVFAVDFDAYCVKGADWFAHAAVGAFLSADIEDWALCSLSLLFWLFFDFDGFSRAYGLADFAADAEGFVQCEFIVFGV